MERAATGANTVQKQFGTFETGYSGYRQTGFSMYNTHASNLNTPKFKAFPTAPVSNLERFLDCTTPTVFLQSLSKSDVRELVLKGCPPISTESGLFFPLGDLWDSFDEWSAYGAGVPIVLNGNETVVQYYVPYLSALQIYTSSLSSPFQKSRRLGDDSDGSELEFRDASSETSSDGEMDRQLNYDTSHCWRGLQTRCVDSNLGSNQNLRLDRDKPWNSQLVREEFVVDEPWSKDNKPGCLLFNFFERSPPCVRVPLSDKIVELARDFPALKTLRSIDLLPSSWLSVAWYPIYRIPTGPTLKGLAACFLTYHSLSTLLSGSRQLGLQELSCVEGPRKSSLQPFGLASYKSGGVIWTSMDCPEHQCANTLQRSAESWLNSLGVHHPDYDFFMSHGPSLRHDVTHV